MNTAYSLFASTLVVASLPLACADSANSNDYRSDLNNIVIADPADCLDPRDHGAILNDGLDDRAALQATIDAAKSSGKPVCLAPGRFDIEINPKKAGERTTEESLRIWNTDGFTMVGAGARSVLAFKGKGIRPDPSTPSSLIPSAWWLLGVRGTRNTYLGHFKIDGASRSETHEQTHSIQIADLPAGFDGNTKRIAISGTKIDHVDFFDPHLVRPANFLDCSLKAPEGQMCQLPNHGGTSMLCKALPRYAHCTVQSDPAGGQIWTVVGFFGGGDCVKIFAEESEGMLASDTTVEGSHAVCDRSFVALQRGVDGYRVVNNTVDLVDDTAVDQEPSGEGTVRGAYIAGNTFRRGGRKVGFMIAMVGGPSDSTNNVITGNILDGAIVVNNASNTVISSNTIEVAEGNAPNISLIRFGSGTRIVGNTLLRAAAADAASAILARIHNDGFPSDAIITENVIRMRSAGHAIEALPGVGMVIDNNIVEGFAPMPNDFSALATRGNKTDLAGTGSERITFTGNQVRGNFRWMVIEDQQAALVNHSTVIQGNIFEPSTTASPTAGVLFKTACPTPPPVVDGNVFRGLPAARHVDGACGTGWIGQNSGP
ncbi:hypothetical protein LZC95_33345 [Pendulispora brunnea]|uniref:Right handed beta helix domain-containing protein n=1 Tax=Pendulispora brunnea TaxID=2905690 RepID=A0ABZ2K3G0_9BACT